jgi:hypothetical protein
VFAFGFQIASSCGNLQQLHLFKFVDGVSLLWLVTEASLERDTNIEALDVKLPFSVWFYQTIWKPKIESIWK